MRGALLSGLILATAAGVANAQVFPFVTGFEAPSYALGALAGQNTWVEINGGTGAPTTNFQVMNTPGNAFGGTQFVQTDTSTWGAFASNTSRFAWVDNTTGVSPIDASLRVFVGTSSGTLASNGGLFLFASSGALMGGMWLRTDGVLAVFNGASQGAGFGANALYPLNAYNEMRIVADSTTGALSYFINGVGINGSLPGTFSPTFTPGLTLGDADLYAARGASGTGGSILRYDDLSVTPAPGSLALLGLGGLVATRRRR